MTARWALRFGRTFFAVMASIAIGFWNIPQGMTPSFAVFREFVYFIFFDHQSDALDEDALAAIAEVMDEYHGAEDPVIYIRGYDDRYGTAEESMEISIRRAEAVSAELISRGVPPERIHTLGVGENDPLVATPDGVLEPSNRRVQISLH